MKNYKTNFRPICDQFFIYEFRKLYFSEVEKIRKEIKEKFPQAQDKTINRYSDNEILPQAIGKPDINICGGDIVYLSELHDLESIQCNYVTNRNKTIKFDDNLIKCLHKSLDILGDPEKDVILMLFGLKPYKIEYFQKEIAKKYNIPETTLSRKIQDILIFLNKYMKQVNNNSKIIFSNKDNKNFEDQRIMCLKSNLIFKISPEWGESNGRDWDKYQDKENDIVLSKQREDELKTKEDIMVETYLKTGKWTPEFPIHCKEIDEIDEKLRFLSKERVKYKDCLYEEKYDNIRGENHPNWVGDEFKGPYPREFNEKYKEQIRKRDNFTCQECGKEWDGLEDKFAVHHIDYDKKNLDPMKKITLCSKCHTPTSLCNKERRKIWTEYYQEKMTIRFSIKNNFCDKDNQN